MYRHYNREFLNTFLEALEEIPDTYPVRYDGVTLCISLEDVKTLLGIDQTKTFSKCYKELDRLCDDLGAMKDNNVSYSKHSLWLWFNFNGRFEGYPEERKAKADLEYKEWKSKRDAEIKKEYDLKTASIKDGTYGLHSKDAGGVYLLSCGEYFKIGYSKNIKSRLSGIRTSNPTEVQLVAKYSPFDKNYPLLESKLHEKFKDSRHLLEWFRKDFTEQDFLDACVDFCKCDMLTALF